MGGIIIVWAVWLLLVSFMIQRGFAERRKYYLRRCKHGLYKTQWCAGCEDERIESISGRNEVM